MKNIIRKAEILIESLPYIRNFREQIFVIKYGGSVMADKEIRELIIKNIILLKYVGIKPVIVHGGGKEINKLLSDLELKQNFIKGLRVTPPETMEYVEMVLSGKVNKEIVSSIGSKGGLGVGISGKDGNLIMAEKMTVSGQEEADLGCVGRVKKIKAGIVNKLLADGYIPVIAPIGINEKGQSFNINADQVAAKLAISLGAEKLIYLSNVDGVMKSTTCNKNSIISKLSLSQARQWIEEEKIKGGMIPKVKSGIEAEAGGVNSIHILNGFTPHALLLEIFTDQGIGTMIVSAGGINGGN